MIRGLGWILHGVLKPRTAGFVAFCATHLKIRGVRHESCRPNRDDMCRAVAGYLQETHLVFSWSGSLQQCAMGAPPYIAQWVDEHPKWNAVKWRCEYPHTHDKADARGATPAG
jgi:hypothetical protein